MTDHMKHVVDAVALLQGVDAYITELHVTPGLTSVEVQPWGCRKQAAFRRHTASGEYASEQIAEVLGMAVDWLNEQPEVNRKIRPRADAHMLEPLAAFRAFLDVSAKHELPPAVVEAAARCVEAIKLWGAL